MESGTLQRPFGVEGALAKGRPPSPTLAQLVPRVGRESISATLSRNKTRNPLGASGRTFPCPKGATSSSPGLARLGPTLISRQPIAWRLPPISVGGSGTASFEFTALPFWQVRRLLLFIRTFQRTGHPHPALSRSTSGSFGFGQICREIARPFVSAAPKSPANRVRNATASGSVGLSSWGGACFLSTPVG